MSKRDHKSHRSLIKQGYYQRQHMVTASNKQRRAAKRAFKRQFWKEKAAQEVQMEQTTEPTES